MKHSSVSLRCHRSPRSHSHNDISSISFFIPTSRCTCVLPSMPRQSKPGKLGYLAAFSSLSKAIGSPQCEPWYQELIERFCAVADFRTYWEQDAETLDQQDAPSKLLLSRHATT